MYFNQCSVSYPDPGPPDPLWIRIRTLLRIRILPVSYHQAKLVRKTSIPTVHCLVTSFGLFIGSGYVSLFNGSGRPKNIWILRIRIRNTADIYGLVWFQGSEDACTGPTWSLQSWRKSSRTTAKAFSHSRRGVEALSSRKRLQTRAVLRIRIRDPVPFWPLDPGSGMGRKSASGSGIRNEQPFDADPGSGMEKSRNTGRGAEKSCIFFLLKMVDLDKSLNFCTKFWLRNWFLLMEYRIEINFYIDSIYRFRARVEQTIRIETEIFCWWAETCTGCTGWLLKIIVCENKLQYRRVIYATVAKMELNASQLRFISDFVKIFVMAKFCPKPSNCIQILKTFLCLFQ